jgi:glycosyltransferase involved in cell wall biosynthesis
VREHYGLGEDRVVVTPLAPRPARDPGPAQPVQAPAVPPRYLLFVGTVEPRKNLATVVRAQRLAAGRDPEHPPLVVVGASGWGGRTADEASTLVLGRVDDATLRRLLGGTAGLVMPSLDEGFGLPVLEAAAAGRPVAASDIPVMREVCAPGTLFAPPTDVEAWSHALADLAGVADGEADRAARRAHAAGFSWQRCAERTLSAYRRAVQLRG